MTTETKTPEKASFIIDTSGDVPILRDGFGCRPANPSELELWHRNAELAKRAGELEDELSDLRQFKREIDGDGCVPATRVQLLDDVIADRDRLTAQLVRADDCRAIERAANAMFEVMKDHKPACYGFHHDRGDRHAVGDPCPLVERYYKALAAFAALRKEEQR